MTRHAEDTLRGAGIAQILDLALAVAAPEAVCAEGLVAGQDSQILDLVAAVVAAVGAVVADERAVAEEQEVRVRVEEGAARVAAEAVNVPSVPGWAMSACYSMKCGGRQARGTWRCLGRSCIPSSKAFPSSRIWTRVSEGQHADRRRLYLSTPLARIYDIVLVHGRLWVRSGRVHGGSM